MFSCSAEALQMSTTQPGALARIASDMTFAPDSPMLFPCKLEKKNSLSYQQSDVPHEDIPAMLSSIKTKAVV